MNTVPTAIVPCLPPRCTPARMLVLCACAVALLGSTREVCGGVVLEAGTIASSDLIAPIDLHVTAVITSERIATSDGQLLPAVVRLDGTVVEAAQRELGAAFRSARAEFAKQLVAAFGEASISEEKINSLRFQSFRSEFVAAHPEFPVGYVLAAAWARGDDGEVVRARMSGVLAQVVGRQLIGRVPEAATIFVVDLSRDMLVRSWSEASSAIVRAVDRPAVLTLAQARAELWRNLGVGERFAGGFLETLVRENVSYEARLTGLFLHERLGTQLAGRFFSRGELLVKAGEPVDASAAEAMRQLEALGLAPLTPMPVAPIAPPVAPAAAPPAERAAAPAAAPMAEPLPDVRAVPTGITAILPIGWMIGVAAAGLLSLVLGVRGYARLLSLRRATRVTDTAGVGSDPSLREVLAPHLAREMTERGMDALFTQRQELLQNTDVATERVAEIETRVAKVQPAIQERMRGYEQRIQALERELQER